MKNITLKEPLMSLKEKLEQSIKILCILEKLKENWLLSKKNIEYFYLETDYNLSEYSEEINNLYLYWDKKYLNYKKQIADYYEQ